MNLANWESFKTCLWFVISDLRQTCILGVTSILGVHHCSHHLIFHYWYWTDDWTEWFWLKVRPQRSEFIFYQHLFHLDWFSLPAFFRNFAARKLGFTKIGYLKGRISGWIKSKEKVLIFFLVIVDWYFWLQRNVASYHRPTSTTESIYQCHVTCWMKSSWIFSFQKRNHNWMMHYVMWIRYDII